MFTVTYAGMTNSVTVASANVSSAVSFTLPQGSYAYAAQNAVYNGIFYYPKLPKGNLSGTNYVIIGYANAGGGFSPTGNTLTSFYINGYGIGLPSNALFNVTYASQLARNQLELRR